MKTSSADSEFRVRSGRHLGLVRAFIQQHAINGSDVHWGSSDILRFSGVTVDDMERLAQRIADLSSADTGAGK